MPPILSSTANTEVVVKSVMKTVVIMFIRIFKTDSISDKG